MHREISESLSQFSQVASYYLTELNKKPVAQLNAELPQTSLSQLAVGNDNALKTLEQQVIPQLSASAGSRYWGFVTGGANPAALFADWLVSTFDQNVSKGGDSVATEVEHQTLSWLKELFYLPDTFDGLITTGATSSNILAAIAARQFAGQAQQINVAQQGMGALSVEIFSTCPHASMVKALGLAGFGQNSVTYIDKKQNTELINLASLEQALVRSSCKSKIVLASAATVTTTSFDDLVSIAELCNKHNAWLHVDAAFGIFERCLNGPEGLTKGIELADSITVDFHKWLNVPYDAGGFFTRHLDLVAQSCEVAAPYLINNSDRKDFLAIGIENSRRFRALPIWYTIHSYGRKGINQWVSKNIECTKLLAKWIEQHPDLTLAFEPNLNVCGFYLTSQPRKTKQLLDEINRIGKVFLSPGQWQGQFIIRAALSNWQTEFADLDIAKSSIDQAIKNIAE